VVFTRARVPYPHASAAVFCNPSSIFGASSHTDGARPIHWIQYDHTNTNHQHQHPLEQIMKLRKNIEGVFIAAAVVATFASIATAQSPQVRVTEAPVIIAANDASIPTVVVTAKRLTAAEKAALN
jgi:hypothetical protein